jgi:hypothetical protein
MSQLYEPSGVITMTTANDVHAADITRHRGRSTPPNSLTSQDVRL